MKKHLFAIILLVTGTSLYAQTDIVAISDSLRAEGRRLYRSEMASWYGTDVFLGKYANQANISGYFSYVENNIAKCIFFSKDETPKVIGTISFDSIYNVKTAQADLAERTFTNDEKELFIIRSTALKTIQSDTLFKSYKDMELNLIPLIYNGQKKVYVLTGPKKDGMVVFGNDYLLLFDNDNNLVSKKQLHRNIIVSNYGNAADGQEVFGTVHSHLPETGDFITATDICTLMLYEKFAKWKQHMVISENYMSIWHCDDNSLTIVPSKIGNGANKDQKKRKKS